MLAADHRMRRRADFSAALRGSRSVARSLVVTLSVEQPAEGASAPAPLVGFVVSRAVGGSTTRNRVRRRLRHAVAPRIGELEPGSRLVIRARPAAASASYAELVRDLDATLGQLLRPRASVGQPS
jgi:ribonuclease P protein component